MSKLKVAIVAPSLRILGGQAVQADSLLRAWQRDADVEAWLVPVNPPPPRVLRAITRVKYLRTIVTELLYLPRLVRELAAADVVHVFSASYASFLLAPLPAILIARALGRPVLLNYHSGEAPDHLSRSAIARFILKRTDRNIVPSRFLVDVFASFGIDAVAISNIVDLERFRFREREPLRPRLLSTRNFATNYNVACTLRAFRLVQERRPDATLTLVGSGPHEGDLRTLATTLGLRNVTFAGSVSPDAIADYYASHDVYIQSPDVDNMPVSVLEAFASGLPVVSTRAGGIPLMLTHGEHGLLAPLNDHRVLASHVLSLLDDAALSRRLTEAAYAACQACTWPAVREHWLAAYRGVVSTAPERPRRAPTRRTIRVAIVAPSLRILGGQAVQADRLLRAWRGDSNVEAWLVPVNPLPPPTVRFATNVKYLRTVITELMYLPLLCRELARADVVHVFSASYLSFLLAPLPAIAVARVLGRPVVLNYRSGEAPDHLKRSAIARATLRRVDENVVPSPFLVDVFRHFAIGATVIPNIVDMRQFTFEARSPLRPKLVSTRNFDALYNVACTLRAFRIVQDCYPDATLTLVGGGSQERTLRTLAAELRLNHVTFVGQVSPDAIVEHYRANDIYVQTPDIDNMPTSVIEAFACGLPVVSTEAGGLPAILTDGVHGLLARVGDHVAVARCILRLLDDGQLAARLTQAAYESCYRCTWPAIRGQWLDVYSRVIARAHAPTPLPAACAVDDNAQPDAGDA